MKNLFLHRLIQLFSLLLGIRFFVLLFLVFALYVSAFFFLGKEGFLEIKIHGIIFCSTLSIAAGGLINQFYDEEKDKIIKPFRTKIKSFLKQKYFLYLYLIFNALSLGVSWFLSWRIFFFFLIYQFCIWFYSHKLSKVLIINNLSYVLLSLYPFFGLLVYYQYFAVKIFLLALFLFFLMLSIDIIKDLMTKEADSILEYQTLPIVFGDNKTRNILCILLFSNILISVLLCYPFSIHSYYFIDSIFLFLVLIYFIRIKKTNWLILSILLKIWVFVGVVMMLVNGFFH